MKADAFRVKKSREDKAMRKLALMALSFAAAVFLTRFILPASWLLPTAALCVAAALGILLIKPPGKLRLTLICLGLAAGLIWAAVFTTVFVRPADRLSGTTQSVTATALAAPEETDYGYRLPVAVHLDGAPDIKTRLYAFSGNPGILPGNTLTLTARFTPADTIYGERTDSYYAKGIYLLAYADGDVAVTDRRTPPRYWPAYLADLSTRMIDSIFPDDVRGFMGALLLGDTSGIYADGVLSSDMASAGASHIIAVSGMHLSFLVGFLNLVIRRKRLLAAAAIPVILVFMAVVGFRPSLARAGVMQIFLLAAPLFRRESDVFTSLAASLMLILAVNPYAAASAGLQLSFGATLGIAVFAGKLYTRLDEPLRATRLYRYQAVQKTVRFFIGGFSSTLGALAFSLPLTAMHFGTVSIVAPVTNLLILLPAALAFTGGMITLILGFVAAPVGIVAAFAASVPARFIVFITGRLSRLPFAALYTSSPAVVIWLVYAWSLLVILWGFRVPWRRLLMPACLAAVSLCALLVIPTAAQSGGLTVTAVDVGQGQSIVLTSGRYTAVVDCGSVSGKDAGDLLIRYLKSHGRAGIDLLVLTHFHTDHAGGVEEVLRRFPVAALAMPDPCVDDDGTMPDAIMDCARAQGVQAVTVAQDLTAQLGRLSIDLLAPLGTADENERGVILLATQNDFEVLITGDIDASTEQRLLSARALPDIEVLVAGHHGSKYACCDELLAAVTPEAALLSVGYNSYGHPAPETLERLARAGIMTYRTDILGDVTVEAW